MAAASTDDEWERWGAADPYYGVLTNPKFRAGAITEEAREEFFWSGQCHVSYVIDTCRRQLDTSFQPQRVLDFGCGVGRLLVAFAASAAEVVGVDVSPSMLAEARRNCDQRGAPQVRLVASDDLLSAVEGRFDLVHSCIVLQHIEVERGLALFSQLVDRVLPGGIGAIHVTYGWDRFADTHGMPPAAAPVAPPSAIAQVRAGLRTLLAPSPAPAPESPADPEMQMNFYALNPLMFKLQRAGVRELHTHFTDHGGALGVFLFFRLPAAT